jgi:hypothetical protein
VALALCAANGSSAVAGSDAPGPTLELSVARWSVLNEGSGATGLGAEYRFMPFPDPRVAVAAGISWTEDGAVYASGSLGFGFRLGRDWVLTPTLAAGLFEEGSDQQLGHAVEFKTGLRLSRRVGRYQLGLMASHISNAGLADFNDGTEIVELTVGFPCGDRSAQSAESASSSAGTAPAAASSSRRISSPASAR